MYSLRKIMLQVFDMQLRKRRKRKDTTNTKLLVLKLHCFIKIYKKVHIVAIMVKINVYLVLKSITPVIIQVHVLDN